MDQAGSNDKKTGGKKSRWTIPLSKVYVCMYCVLYNHHSPVSDLISVLWILIRQNLNYMYCLIRYRKSGSQDDQCHVVFLPNFFVTHC